MRKPEMIAVAALLGACGAYCLLLSIGVLHLPVHTASPAHHAPKVSTNEVLIPVCNQNMPAGMQITRNVLSNRVIQWIVLKRLPASWLQKNTITNTKSLIGRVIKRDKPAGQMFYESDFIPLDSPLSLPEGMRAVPLSASLLAGANSIHAGDRIDIVGQRRQSTRVVVRDATVMVAVPAATHSGKPMPADQVTIAIKIQDVQPLYEALTSGDELACRPHSDLPDQSPAPTTRP